MNRFLLPLIGFVVLLGFLAVGLTLNPKEVPSPFIGKPAPAFRVPQLQADNRTIGPEDMRGKVWLLNVWSSWCVSCREEHPVLVDFARQNLVTIVGLNYKDKREDGLAWLAERGDPYAMSAYDGNGTVGIDWGVYGVPETFVIDKAGVIRYKHTGPITPDSLNSKLIPLIKELNGA